MLTQATVTQVNANLALDCPANLYFLLWTVVSPHTHTPVVLLNTSSGRLARVPIPFFAELSLSTDFDYMLY